LSETITFTLPRGRGEKRIKGLVNFAVSLIKFSRGLPFPISARGWCLTPDALISAERGLVSAQNITADDSVLSLSSKGYKVDWKKVLEIHQRNFSGNLIKIKAYNLFPLLVTPEHPIATVTVKTEQKHKQKKWREVGDIHWVSAKDIVIKPSPFKRSRTALCYLINREVVDQPLLDEGLCELMGYYLAEGSPIRTDRPNKTLKAIEFSLNIRENGFAEDVKTLAKKYFNANTSIIDRKEQGTKRVFVYSAKMARFLVKYCGEGASTKQLSQAIMLLPPKKQFLLFLAFVRGDGETKENWRRAYTTSKALALQFQQICLRNNKIPTGMVRTNNGEGDNLPLYELMQIESNRHIGIIKGDMFFALIRKIEKVHYSGQVYNYDVKSNHNYCADGILVHNCYTLEGYNVITKDKFNRVESLINECRKIGFLPIDFVAEEEARKFSGVEIPHTITPEQYLKRYLEAALDCENRFTPEWWEGEEYYIQMIVEKVDLKSLFEPVCREYHIPIATSKGWSSMYQRAEYARRFKEAEDQGLKCVLLYCGDHDPDGLRISYFLRKNLDDLASIRWNDKFQGYDPRDLIIQRFGLDFDFIEENNLSWINNLITGSGKNLNSPDHPNHYMDYVQDYLGRYGARKCEANAIIRPDMLDLGMEMCRQAIEGYVGEEALWRFQEKRQAIVDRLEAFRERTELDTTIQEAIDLIDEESEDEEGE